MMQIPDNERRYHQSYFSTRRDTIIKTKAGSFLRLQPKKVRQINFYLPGDAAP